MIWFGFIGMLLVQTSLSPQMLSVYHAYKAGVRLAGVSEMFYWILTAGLASYLVYSIWRQDAVYIASNIIGLTQAIATLTIVRKARAL